MKFINMDQSASLNQFMEQQSQSLRQRLSAYPRKYDLNLSVTPEQRRDGLVTLFKVTGNIHVAGQRDLRATKTDADVKKATAQVIGALEKQMRRLTRKEVRSRYTLGKSLNPVRDFIRSHQNSLQAA